FDDLVKFGSDDFGSLECRSAQYPGVVSPSSNTLLLSYDCDSYHVGGGQPLLIESIFVGGPSQEGQYICGARIVLIFDEEATLLGTTVLPGKLGSIFLKGNAPSRQFERGDRTVLVCDPKLNPGIGRGVWFC